MRTSTLLYSLAVFFATAQAAPVIENLSSTESLAKRDSAHATGLDIKRASDVVSADISIEDNVVIKRDDDDDDDDGEGTTGMVPRSPKKKPANPLAGLLKLFGVGKKGKATKRSEVNVFEAAPTANPSFELSVDDVNAAMESMDKIIVGRTPQKKAAGNPFAGLLALLGGGGGAGAGGGAGGGGGGGNPLAALGALGGGAKGAGGGGGGGGNPLAALGALAAAGGGKGAGGGGGGGGGNPLAALGALAGAGGGGGKPGGA